MPLPRTHPTAFASSLARLPCRRSRPSALSPLRRPLTRSSVRASLSPPSSPSPDEENTAHPSWRIYSQPGNPCVLCLGQGAVKCVYCFGEGEIRIGPDPARDTLSCPQCDGATKVPCLRCRGSGIRPSTRLDPTTGAVLANPTNADLNTPKTQVEIDKQLADEAAAAAQAVDEEAAAARADDAVGEDLPVEGNGVQNLV